MPLVDDGTGVIMQFIKKRKKEEIHRRRYFSWEYVYAYVQI